MVLGRNGRLFRTGLTGLLRFASLRAAFSRLSPFGRLTGLFSGCELSDADGGVKFGGSWSGMHATSACWLRCREVVAGHRGAGRDGFVALPLAPF